jgi:hypothetical protein
VGELRARPRAGQVGTAHYRPAESIIDNIRSVEARMAVAQAGSPDRSGKRQQNIDGFQAINDLPPLIQPGQCCRATAPERRHDACVVTLEVFTPSLCQRIGDGV